MRVLSLSLIALLLATVAPVCAQQGESQVTASSPSDARVSHILKAGKLRAALFLPLFEKASDGSAVRPRGPEAAYLVEITRALATRIGVEVQLIGYPTPAEATDGLKAGACDLTFLGIDPARSGDLDFSTAYVQADFTYLVPQGSSIRSAADVDQAGLRIAAIRNHGSTRALSRILTRAEIIYGDTPEAAVNFLRSGQAAALASVRSGLLDYAVQLPGSSALQDRYGELLLAFAIAKGQADWRAYLTEFVEEAKASGLIDRALKLSGVGSVKVAPPVTNK